MTDPTLADVLAKLEAIQTAIDRQGVVAPKYVGIADAANYSGLSVESIRGLLSSGKLTALRVVRGRVTISIEELDGLIRSSTNSLRGGRGQRQRPRQRQVAHHVVVPPD
jgi:hypothetical protein